MIPAMYRQSDFPLPQATSASEPRKLREDLIFGSSPRMRLIQSQLRLIARSTVPVLVQGESGTGKEVVARFIHELSTVSAGPFVTLSCPAIPAPLFESELFGYTKGAFTGANTNKSGRLSLAHAGTLFLDEIAELDTASQAKLLHFLQRGTFSPIGGEGEVSIAARIISATSRNLEAEIAAGKFRKDLLYRLNVVHLHLPRLRERKDDLPALVRHFISFYNAEFSCSAKAISPELLHLFEQYHWPGNIRQLENLIKRYVILGSEETISLDFGGREQACADYDKLPEIAPGSSISLKKITKDMVRDFEQRVIIKVLQAHSWNRVRAARALGISYRALLYKLKDCGESSQNIDVRNTKPSN